MKQEINSTHVVVGEHQTRQKLNRRMQCSRSLSVELYLCRTVYLSVSLSDLYVCLSFSLSVCLSVFVCLSVGLSVSCVCVCVCVCVFVCVCVYPSICD